MLHHVDMHHHFYAPPGFKVLADDKKNMQPTDQISARQNLTIPHLTNPGIIP
jgi:hypothetical protein